MSKKKKQSGTTAPLTPEQQAAAKASAQKTTRTIWIAAAVLIVMLLTISVRNIVGSYYYAFVVRNETIDTAVASIDAYLYTSAEEAEQAELLTQWDNYANARLRDTVTVDTADGVTLGGYYYDNGSDVTVLVLRGYHQTAEEEFLYAPYFQDYNLLLPDARAHGISGGEAYTFGALEQEDVALWLQWIADELGDQQVILYGEDAGASTALLAGENGLLTEQVAFVVAESPFSTLAEWAEYSMREWYKIPAAMTKLMGTYADKQGVFDYRTVDVVTNGAQGSCPVLFLVGENNELVPSEESLAVYQAWGGEKELCSYASRNGLIYAEHTQEIQETLGQWEARYLAEGGAAQ